MRIDVAGQPAPPAPRARLSSLVCLLALVGAARVAVTMRTEAIARDGAVFLHMARELTGGTEVDDPLRAFRQHPAYPALIGAAARATGTGWPDGWAMAAQVISVVMGLAAVAAVYVIGVDFFGRKVGLVGALVFGLSPRFSHIACDVNAEPTALALGLWAIVAALRARPAIAAGRWRGAWLGAAAGLLGGLAYLTRPELLLAPVLAVLAMLAVRGVSRRWRGFQLAAVAATVAAAAVCVLPYAVALGGLTLKKSISDFAGVGADLPLAAAAVKAQPAALHRVADRLAQAMGPAGSVAAGLAVLTWVGLYVLRVKLPSAVRIVPAAHGALLMLAALVATLPLMTALEANHGPRYVSTRHMLTCAALLAPAAGAGVLIVAGWVGWLLGRLGLRRAATPIGLTIALAAALVPTLPRALAPLHEGKRPHRDAGRLLVRLGGGGHFVVAPNSRVPFHALAPAEQFTEGTDMSPTLTARDLRSVDALLARLRRPDPRRQYRFLALDRKGRKAAAEAGTFRDPRTDQTILIPLVNVGKGDQRVDLFHIRPPSPPTTAPSGAK
ncbi:MAG: ArnT family glycosyltransferase [Planctomycetota bacterium]|jgi:hypothetical protein